MDTRSDTGFGYNILKWIESFWIGAIECVKKLKSVELRSECECMETSLTGRPGMSKPSQESMALTQVRLDKNFSSTSSGGKGS